MLLDYYHLTKPGIIYGNCLAAIAGFFVGADKFELQNFIAMLVGLALIIASACVLNNIYDSDMDAKMDRTKNRAIVLSKISKTSALVYAILLLIFSISGFTLFNLHFSLIPALLGFFFYVFLYTPLKTKTTHATLVGAIAGATPPVVGYTAAGHGFNLTALLLFFILFIWQMPHFYSIGLFRSKDYASALVPILPLKKSFASTRGHIIFYIILFLVTAPLLSVFGFAGKTYLVLISLLGIYWLYKALKTPAGDPVKWGKKIFLTSLIILTSWCVIIPIDKLVGK